jgi:RNA polymerase sigma-70 factor (ECF subfamily)
MSANYPSSNDPKPISELLVKKDIESLEQLLTWYRPFLREIAEQLLGKRLKGKMDASDLVQETLNNILLGFPKVRAKTRGEWKSYLHRVMARKVADARKLFLGNQKRDIDREIDASKVAQGIEEIIDEHADKPIDEMINREFAKEVLGVVERLPKEVRHILRWRYRKAMTYEQIGARVNRSKDDVRMLIRRCIDTIRQELEDRV